MLLEDGEHGFQLRIRIIGHSDEFSRHPRVDVHLTVAHVSNEIHTHHPHLPVDQITSTVARVGGQDQSCTRPALDSIHDLQGLDLESLRDLERHQPVIPSLDALDEVIHLEVVAFEIHASRSTSHS